MNTFLQTCSEYPFWAGSLFTLIAWAIFWVGVGWEPLVSVKHITQVVDQKDNDEESS